MPRITPSHRTIRARIRVLRYPDGTFAAQNTDLWSPVLAMKEAEEEKNKLGDTQPPKPPKPAPPTTPTTPTSPTTPTTPSVPEAKKPGIVERTWDNYSPVVEAIPGVAKDIWGEVSKGNFNPAKWNLASGMDVVTKENPYVPEDGLKDQWKELAKSNASISNRPKKLDADSPEVRQWGWKQIQDMASKPLINSEGVIDGYRTPLKDGKPDTGLQRELIREGILIPPADGNVPLLRSPALGPLSSKVLDIPMANSDSPELHAQAVAKVIQEEAKNLTPMEKFQGGGKLVDELARDGRRLMLMGRTLESQDPKNKELAKSYYAKGLLLTQAAHATKAQGEKSMALARNKMAWGVGLLAAGIPIMTMLYRMFRGPRQQPIQINMPAAQQPAYVQAAYGGRQFGA